MKKVLAIVLALMLALTCAALAEAAPAPESITVTDDLGRTVELEAVPETIVSLTPSNTEILYALGVGDKIVGVDASSDYPAEVAGTEIVGDYSGPNLEAIVAANADVVIAGTYLAPEMIDEMEQLGLTVVCVQVDSYDAIPADIQLLADVTGTDAAPVLEAMEAAKTAALDAIVAREAPLKVYFCLGFGEYGDYTAGPGTFIDELITMAGGQNVVTDPANPWPAYSMEQLVLDDPDVILISDYIGDGTTLVEQLSAAEGYKDLRCVQAGNVFCVDANTTSRPAPRINDALAEIVGILNSVE